MANKRMFSKTIVNSDAFLDMPCSTQNLYFHLNMVADDDGFVNSPKRIMRMVGASEDDLKLLIAKAFLLSFDTGIIVIKHWRMNNYIQNDRYKKTVYQDEKALLELKNNGAYSWKHAMDTECIQNVSEMYPQIRLDKNSIDKISIEEIRRDYDEVTKNAMTSLEAMIPVVDVATCNPTIRFVGIRPNEEEVKLYCSEKGYTFDVDDFMQYYDEVNWTTGDGRHSVNWKKKCEMWQSNQIKKKDDSKKVGVPDFMRQQADGIEKESKVASEDAIEKIKQLQEEMKGE